MGGNMVPTSKFGQCKNTSKTTLFLWILPYVGKVRILTRNMSMRQGEVRVETIEPDRHNAMSTLSSNLGWSKCQDVSWQCIYC